MRHFDGDRYLLGDYVVMPNHVHVLVQPLGAWKLDQIMHSWKSFTSKEINKCLGTKGVFWRDESFDHIVRSAAQWRRFTRYIRENPVKAHLAPGGFRLGCGKRASCILQEEEGASGVSPEDPKPPAGETPAAHSSCKMQEAQYHANGLRLWENDDLVPRPDDVFQERLYCVRWIETRIDKKSGNPRTTKIYRAVTEHDLAREQLTLDLLRERFADWQEKGFIPSMEIELGQKTDEPIRTRGWTHWHHLFNPRQLLTISSLLASSQDGHLPEEIRSALLLGIGKCADWNSRLARWWTDAGHEKVVQTFSNQALNTLFSYGTRGLLRVDDSWFYEITPAPVSAKTGATISDCRILENESDIWITDPPYAQCL